MLHAYLNVVAVPVLATGKHSAVWKTWLNVRGRSYLAFSLCCCCCCCSRSLSCQRSNVPGLLLCSMLGLEGQSSVDD